MKSPKKICSFTKEANRFIGNNYICNMASILEFNPELRSQIARAAAGVGPKKKANVFFLSGTEFEQEAKRMLPLLEKKYGKGMVNLIPVEYGDAGAISKAIKTEPAGDTFIFDHAGGTMLGVPMSKDDAIRAAKNYEQAADAMADRYTEQEGNKLDGSKIQKYGEPWSAKNMFYKYLLQKYSQEKVDELNDDQLRKEWVEMNKTENYPKQTGPFIPEEEYKKNPEYENIGEHNISKEGTQTPIISEGTENELRGVFQKYLYSMDEANKIKKDALGKNETWETRFPKDYKGECYWGACHFADKASKFAEATGIPTYATIKKNWEGGNPQGKASTQQEFLRNLFYNTDLSKFENGKENILQQSKTPPERVGRMGVINVTPIYGEQIQDTTENNNPATAEEAQEINRLLNLYQNNPEARSAALQPIYDRINARRNQR
jgi:hypothetical protein